MERTVATATLLIVRIARAVSLRLGVRLGVDTKCKLLQKSGDVPFRNR